MNKRSSIFWGILLIILALLLFLLQAGILEGMVWDYFWPFALVLTGTWMLIGYFKRAKPSITEEVFLGLDGATDAVLKIDHGAGRVNLHSGAPEGKVFTGYCSGGLSIQADRTGSHLNVKLHTPSQFWDWAPGTGLNWDLALTSRIPLELNVDTGASASTLDLSDLLIHKLKLTTGASSAEITMPAHAGETIADIDTGVSAVKINIPSGVSARIRVKTGISALRVNKDRFPHLDGITYQSPDYSTNTNLLDLTIDCGVGSVEIN